MLLHHDLLAVLDVEALGGGGHLAALEVVDGGVGGCEDHLVDMIVITGLLYYGEEVGVASSVAYAVAPCVEGTFGREDECALCAVATVAEEDE